MQDRKIYFIIVAAGGGTRFGGDIPKQFRQLGGKTVLCHSIDTFTRYCRQTGVSGEIIIVLSQAGKEFWNEHESSAYPGVAIVPGGATRAESVSNAIDTIKDFSEEDIIMVHDGARPLISCNLLRRLSDAVTGGCRAVVPALAPTDSLMEKTDGSGAMPVDRSRFLAVQTPQAFKAEVLKKSYASQKEDIARMTDDASVVFAATFTPIEYIEGEVSNIKVTNPADLPLAEILLTQCCR